MYKSFAYMIKLVLYSFKKKMHDSIFNNVLKLNIYKQKFNLLFIKVGFWRHVYSFINNKLLDKFNKLSYICLDYGIPKPKLAAVFKKYSMIDLFSIVLLVFVFVLF